MDAALCLVEALPAAGARVFARVHGLGAVCTADARVVVIVELVVRHVVLHDVGQTCFSLHAASGLIFTSPNLLSHSTILTSRRVSDWSRRMPDSHALFPASARWLVSTFRRLQQASGSRSHSAAPYFSACSSTVISDL